MARKVYTIEQKKYGALRGTKIYYTGFPTRPTLLAKKGGGFSGLKHILEIIGAKFPKYKFIITAKATPKYQKKKRTHHLIIPLAPLRGIYSKKILRTRDVLTRIGQEILHDNFPTKFPKPPKIIYRPGALAEIFTPDFDPRLLNTADRAALTRLFKMERANTIDIGTAYKASRDSQLIYLDSLIAEFEREIAAEHLEGWWQTYFNSRILFFQDSYIRVIDRLNVSIGTTRYPDFLVVSSDGYLDIIEIKTPDTELLREDKSRGNFYWGTEVAKAITQVENYIEKLTKFSDAIRNELRDKQGIDFQIVKPRGIVIVGTTAGFGSNQKKADDFRLLNNGLKNLEIVPFDELAQRLRNTRTSLQKLSTAMKPGKKSA